MVKNPPAMQERCVQPFDQSGRSPGEGADLTTPAFLPGKSYGQRRLSFGPWGHKELDMTEAI